MHLIKFRLPGWCLALNLVAVLANAQGTFVFQNLDFESANLSGYSPGDRAVPISTALPGWSAYIGADQIQQVWYDVASAGSAAISISDQFAAGQSYPPLQGNYSAILFSGGSGNSTVAATISQTGFVPVGTRSLVVDIFGAPTPPVVTLGGQTITMVPEITFPRYTLYAGNIAGFAGQTATLSFSAPAVSTGSILELDNIGFSTAAVPEPGAGALLALGALFVAGNCIHQRK